MGRRRRRVPRRGCQAAGELRSVTPRSPFSGDQVRAGAEDSTLPRLSTHPERKFSDIYVIGNELTSEVANLRAELDALESQPVSVIRLSG